jgi:diadenosine tetraphosphate (Ap4A) HIT family hydrolase
MPRDGAFTPTLLSDVIGGRNTQWGKKAQDWEKTVGNSEVVYEDEHVIAFHDPEDSPHESARVTGEIRITVLPKKPVPTLIDLNVTDEELNARMLFAVQQVAYKLGLQKKGFEVRSHVLPPYQHRPGFALHIRAGKPPAQPKKDSNASSASSSP